MTTTFHNVPCPRCGASRSPDLKVPCAMCGSRMIPFLGYTYGVERSWFIVILLVLMAICILALITGAIYVFWRVWQIGSVGVNLFGLASL